MPGGTRCLHRCELLLGGGGRAGCRRRLWDAEVVELRVELRRVGVQEQLGRLEHLPPAARPPPGPDRTGRAEVQAQRRHSPVAAQ